MLSQLHFATLAAGTFLGAVCAVAAVSIARFFKRTSTRSVTTCTCKSVALKLEAVTESLAELREAVGTLGDRYENLRARVGMRETRAARGAAPGSGLTGEAWKDAVRKELKIAITRKAGE